MSPHDALQQRRSAPQQAWGQPIFTSQAQSLKIGGKLQADARFARDGIPIIGGGF